VFIVVGVVYTKAVPMQGPLSRHHWLHQYADAHRKQMNKPVNISGACSVMLNSTSVLPRLLTCSCSNCRHENQASQYNSEQF
jgi:hypothetical protein